MALETIVTLVVFAFFWWKSTQFQKKEAARRAEEKEIEALMRGQGLNSRYDTLLHEVQKDCGYEPINKYLTKQEIREHKGSGYNYRGEAYTKLTELIKKRKNDEYNRKWSPPGVN